MLGLCLDFLITTLNVNTYLLKVLFVSDFFVQFDLETGNFFKFLLYTFVTFTLETIPFISNKIQFLFQLFGLGIASEQLRLNLSKFYFYLVILCSYLLGPLIPIWFLITCQLLNLTLKQFNLFSQIIYLFLISLGCVFLLLVFLLKNFEFVLRLL